MDSSCIEGAAITTQPLSQGSPIEHDSDVLRQFETCREFVNGHLKEYFEYTRYEKIQDDVPGLYASPILLRGSEADKSAQLSQINAIKDLAKLDGILENIKRQRQLHIKAVSPLIVAWTAFCITWPYATSQGDLSVLFKIGAVSGAFIIAAQLVRKFLQLRKITPLQHKVRGLVRAFKNGTIRYRDPEEVMISSLNKL
ncbi:hypothetical protein FVEG_16151 [Fusarium verticillioides 7600]|uniref:Uncharacterized protein n=1 Tax=Gibberella moniliformis (strain M3125 / FGSC 7600) TaxID=334819 RepID=W7M7I8_GIBM7|nr:hypothetical protein FVEG_16151 [Fusarium verticillioides 7600]EWG47538.1 hypothetical protein FVEG_16151 [Fusarium verticillioides 7600]